ncbi:MAG TPA: FeoA family protein [Pirellulales bacterium]
MILPVPLQLLEAGQVAAVTDVVGGRETVHRLHELGLRRGAEVEMIQPGSPCIVRLEGHRLCLRGDELLNVLVRPEVTA